MMTSRGVFCPHEWRKLQTLHFSNQANKKFMFKPRFSLNTHRAYCKHTTPNLAFPVCHSFVVCAKANRIKKRESGEFYTEF